MENGADSSWWGLEPLQPDAHDFRRCGRGRLVECLTRDWKPVIQEVPDTEDDSVGRYQLVGGNLDGKWLIFR